MYSFDTLVKRLEKIDRVSVHGPWSRAVGFHLLKGPPPGAAVGSAPQPLWPGGAARKGGRFTEKGGCDTLYLAQNPVVALQEVVSVFLHPKFGYLTIDTSPWVVVTLDGVIADVVDLTNSKVRKELLTNLAELSGDWLYAQSTKEGSPSQLLGKAAHASGIAGLQYSSSKAVGRGNAVAVFTDHLSKNRANYLEVMDEYKNLSQRLP